MLILDESKKYCQTQSKDRGGVKKPREQSSKRKSTARQTCRGSKVIEVHCFISTKHLCILTLTRSVTVQGPRRISSMMLFTFVL